jgi:hypothetical protein
MAHRKKIARGARRRVYERDDWTCQDCGLQLLPTTPEQANGTHAPMLLPGNLEIVWLELDHVVPLALGGTNAEQNLRALCSPCNRRKSADLQESLLSPRPEAQTHPGERAPIDYGTTVDLGNGYYAGVILDEDGARWPWLFAEDGDGGGPCVCACCVPHEWPGPLPAGIAARCAQGGR